jgi:hypothetical protein
MRCCFIRPIRDRLSFLRAVASFVMTAQSSVAEDLSIPTQPHAWLSFSDNHAIARRRPSRVAFA